MGNGVDTVGMRNRCLVYIANARQCLAANALVPAYQSVDRAAASAVDADLRQQIIDICKSLEENGGKMLAAADKEYLAGKYTDAMRIYRTVCCLSQLKVGATARMKISAAEKDPAFAAVARNAKAADVYNGIHRILKCPTDDEAAVKGGAKEAATQPMFSLADGAAAEDSDEADVAAHAQRAIKASPADQAKLMTVLDCVIKGYPGTPSAKCATLLRERLMADPAFAVNFEKQKKDDSLKADYDWAVQCEKNGMSEKAAQYYRKVVVDSPDSEWGLRAKFRLEVLEADKKNKP